MQPEDDGRTVKDLLKKRLSVSSSLLSRLKLQENGIMLDGVRVTVRAAAKAGQTLRILSDVPRGTPAVAVKGAIDIVFEDEHMLILNKPAGIAAHPSRGHYDDTLANRVSYYLGTHAPVRLVNRIDRNTSGLLCIAKNAYSAQQLARELQMKKIEREYLAVVDSVDLPAEGIIDLPIARCDGHGIMREVRADGQRAVTRFWRVCAGEKRSLVRVLPETGRTHQIRVHFAHIGASVAGDFMYGHELKWLQGHALHSHILRMTHPVSGEKLTFSAAPPPYFDKLMQEK